MEAKYYFIQSKRLSGYMVYSLLVYITDILSLISVAPLEKCNTIRFYQIVQEDYISLNSEIQKWLITVLQE